MTFKEASIHIINSLAGIYPHREAANIADLLLEKLSGLRRIDRLMAAVPSLNIEQTRRLEEWLQALKAGRPMQYVIAEAWFYGMPFYVDEHVLIPRPETEELVEWIVADAGSKIPEKILDIGTGSGCIAIALQKSLPNTAVTALDVSTGALSVARKNAASLSADIVFQHLDILNQTAWQAIHSVDIIVSNPPYIPQEEERTMAGHVTGYEPHTALFVPDDSPLLFYNVIADVGLEKLNETGAIYVELHEDFAQQTLTLFASKGYKDVIIKKDMQGKERMLRAFR